MERSRSRWARGNFGDLCERLTTDAEAKGENYDADFLRINPFGTVPTLVVPLEKNLHDTEAKYKAITDSRPIVR